MFLLPVGDRTIVHQSAQIISETDLFGSRPHLNKSNAATAEPVVTEESTDVTMEEATVAEPEILVSNDQMPRYYIIVGVYEVKEVAEKMMEKLMDGGFTERGWMKRPGRIDVYAASFADREEAEGTLRRYIWNTLLTGCMDLKTINGYVIQKQCDCRFSALLDVPDVQGTQAGPRLTGIAFLTSVK